MITPPNSLAAAHSRRLSRFRRLWKFRSLSASAKFGSPAAVAERERNGSFTHSMKTIIFAFLLLCMTALRTLAGGEPLIPTPLNDVLFKVRPGMSTNQIVSVLSTAYPNVEVRMGDWSGQTGYTDYKIDERFTLSISCITREGKYVVHDN